MKKYAILIISFCAILFSNNINAQVFSIGNQSTKDAVLDLSEASQTGLILPRMTTAQRNAIRSPALGLIIYNTSLKTIEVFTNNPKWHTLENDILGPATGTQTPGGGMIISAAPADVVSKVAMLEVKSTTKGILLPSATPNSVSKPRTGLMVYNPNNNKLEIFANNQWTKLKHITVTSSSATGTNTTNTGVLIADSKTEDTPHHSALLEIRSTTGNKGFLLPSLTNDQRDALKPEAGIVIYNKETEKINYCDGTGATANWRVLLDEACIPSQPAVAIVSNPPVICDGDIATLSISGGSLGDGADWYWYDDQCDGNLIGTGSSIDVYPSVTTTYYVRAMGDCGVTACVSYTLIVNYIPLNVSVDFSVNPICTESNLTLLSSASNNIDSWTWTGPNAYSSSQNNAVVPSVQASAEGQYTLVAGNQCGPAASVSTETLVVQPGIPNTPTSAGNHVRCHAGVVWKWNAVQYAEGYKFNTINEYSTATDVGNVVAYIHLDDYDPNTEYTVYVWAYNDCGHSDNVLTLVYTTPNETFACGDNFKDCRDELVYQSVLINNQCWMSENLKYLPAVYGPTQGSDTEARYYINMYNGNDVTAAKAFNHGGFNIYGRYGVLYNWTAAMNGASDSDAVPSGVQGACPHGWHLPSDQETKNLEIFIGMCTGTAPTNPAPTPGMRCADDQSFRGAHPGVEVGRKLKGTQYWAYPSSLFTLLSGYPVAAGQNTYGFNLMPAGAYDYLGQKFTEYLPSPVNAEVNSYGIGGAFWTSSLQSSTNAISRAYSTVTSGTFGSILGNQTVPNNYHSYGSGRYYVTKGNAISIRCILD